LELGTGGRPSWALPGSSRRGPEPALASRVVQQLVNDKEMDIVTLSESRDRGPDGHLWPRVALKKELDDGVPCSHHDPPKPSSHHHPDGEHFFATGEPVDQRFDFIAVPD